ncbi:MAG: hypothetical protein HQL46_03575 [Gammaproteobacteria bacterium]|nr:hypothetical protein [Gammaproteobacteria bacterium]
MNPQYCQIKQRKQLGLTTLIFSSIILFAISLVVLYASKSALIEQKIHNNLSQTNQDLLGSESNLNEHINDFKKLTADKLNVDLIAYLDQIENTTQEQKAYKITSTSKKNSNNEYRFSTWFSKLPILGNQIERLPVFPLIVKHAIAVNSTFQVINGQFKRTIWAGAEINFGQSENSNTQIMINNNLVITSNSAKGNHIDIIESDRNLAILDNEEFFSRLMNESSRWIKQWAIDQSSYYLVDQLDKIDLSQNLIWIGDGVQEVSLSSILLGSSTKPVFMFVDARAAKLITKGNISINGLLYVRGDWQPQGNIQVKGMVIVEGQILPSLIPEFTQTRIQYLPENLVFKSSNFSTQALINGSYQYPDYW